MIYKKSLRYISQIHTINSLKWKMVSWVFWQYKVKIFCFMELQCKLNLFNIFKIRTVSSSDWAEPLVATPLSILSLWSLLIKQVFAKTCRILLKIIDYVYKEIYWNIPFLINIYYPTSRCCFTPNITTKAAFPWHEKNNR